MRAQSWPVSKRLIALAALLFTMGGSFAAAEEPVEAPVPPAVNSSPQDVAALAKTIDRHITARWDEEHAVPAARAGDAEFLRRVYLDIVGKIPPVSEVRAFLADPSPAKRRDIVERLLENPGYTNHFTTFWRRVMLPEANTSFQARYMVPGFEAWLRTQLQKNAGYDELVREIVTAQPTRGQNIYAYQNGGTLTPIAFYQAKQNKPENLAAATSRMFLGIRLECAQCHNHPFDNWQREQFWSFAAFYSPIGPQPRQQSGVIASITKLFGVNKPKPKGLRIPDTKTYVNAALN